MKDKRSGTQVLFGFLPEQTADLQGRIWKTVDWRDPKKVDVDETAIRRRLEEEIYGWNKDRSAIATLNAVDLEVVEINGGRGVKVERFPNVFVCRSSNCRRVENRDDRDCRCGQKRWEQVHFVGYHECGRLEQPLVPRCQQHDQVRMDFQPTIDASKIRFICPVCSKLLRQGFGFRRCPCGRKWDGRESEFMAYNVHRSTSVYTPQSFVLINPGTSKKLAEITESGGPRRALTWVLGGMAERHPSGRMHTAGSLVDQLVATGIERSIAEQMASVASGAGQLAGEDDLGLMATAPVERIHEAERAAVDIAVATFEGRSRIAELDRHGVPEQIRRTYRDDYPAAVARAGLDTVELADRFPVMRAVYGFTRGGSTPGQVNLNLFSSKKGRRVFADPQQSEALMFRLDPLRVGRWMRARGHAIPETADKKAARAALAANISLPNRFDDPSIVNPGVDLLTLIHSYAHRVIRQLSVFAGVDRESLGEYLLPTHGVFFVFAAARGDFVLGGLQAVFENDLHTFLHAVVNAEHRCPLDPACERNGGACVACTHLGEPVCGHFNNYLGRDALFGPAGYFALNS
ncbi:hypothetical protein [Catelliglobosispora koreensis]|uniref:hypothetical protein n=1 Tax=Catelliglobosispora koreensis TaxID=129052 RepID=UPI00036FB909|nr:hypothetical protein [Catelliglobosispora koreensis]